ncbi:MAG TPA: hypothetical protein VHT03_14440 [Rhizomicrobium sp.]|jgi:hypothetical protein|nr:hypothetical protein [Rhizomicrobium sp.]
MTAAWTVERETAKPETSAKIVIKSHERAMTFDEVIAGWRKDAAFRAFYCATLAAAPYPAFLWEMPPIRRGQTDIPYEFMLIRSDSLAHMAPDTQAFAAQFRTTSNFVATFPNLGRDAVLVAPEQVAASAAYAHLAAFVRSAPQTQQHELFRAVGDAVHDFIRMYDTRVWISTSGLGIPWLHVRLDTVPKYYQHQPYARL